MKLKFIGDGRIDGKLVFESGKVYEVDEESGSAARWVRRNLAIEVKEEVSVKEEIKEEVKEVEVENIAIPEVKVENKKGSKSKKGK
jgi:hypothetical protein